MGFFIVPQTIKIKGEDVKVLVKPVRYFPKLDQHTKQVVDFGKINAKTVGHIYQVVIAHDSWKPEDVWTIRYNVDRNWFTILWSIQLDPVDPWDKRYQGIGHVRRVENIDRHLSVSMCMNMLNDRNVQPHIITEIMMLFNNVAAKLSAA